MEKDIAYPIRIGSNGDINVCHGYDEHVKQSIAFVIDNFPGDIAGYPEMGLPLEPFDPIDDTFNPLMADIFNYDLILQEPRIEKIFNYRSSIPGTGVYQIDFDYTTHGGAKNHFSTKYYEVSND